MKLALMIGAALALCGCQTTDIPADLGYKPYSLMANEPVQTNQRLQANCWSYQMGSTVRTECN